MGQKLHKYCCHGDANCDPYVGPCSVKWSFHYWNGDRSPVIGDYTPPKMLCDTHYESIMQIKSERGDSGMVPDTADGFGRAEITLMAALYGFSPPQWARRAQYKYSRVKETTSTNYKGF